MLASCWTGTHPKTRGVNSTTTLRDRCRRVTFLTMRHRVEIHYCTQCRWLMRSTWIAQELLTTFEEEIAELALVPGTGGIFNPCQ